MARERQIIPAYGELAKTLAERQRQSIDLLIGSVQRLEAATSRQRVAKVTISLPWSRTEADTRGWIINTVPVAGTVRDTLNHMSVVLTPNHLLSAGKLLVAHGMPGESIVTATTPSFDLNELKAQAAEQLESPIVIADAQHRADAYDAMEQTLYWPEALEVRIDRLVKAADR
jgi:hypothetical protein